VAISFVISRKTVAGFESAYGGQDWVCLGLFFGEVKLRYIILEHKEHLFGNQNSRL
jgi:hypothetical protein